MSSSSELCSAVRQGDLESVKLLLVQGANVNDKDENGDNALHWAVFCGHTRLVEELLAWGVDWAVRSGKAGYSVLHEAAWDGSTDILTHLLLRGVDVNLCSSNGCTALHEAAYRGHLEFLQLLVAGGGDVYLKCNEGRTPLDWARLARQNDIVEWLGGVMKSPRCLETLCVKAVRQALKRALKTSVPSLPLPHSMLQTLVYQ